MLSIFSRLLGSETAPEIKEPVKNAESDASVTAIATPRKQDSIDRVIEKLTNYQTQLEETGLKFVEKKKELLSRIKDLPKLEGLKTGIESLKEEKESKDVLLAAKQITQDIVPLHDALVDCIAEAKDIEKSVTLSEKSIELANKLSIEIVRIKSAVLDGRNIKVIGRMAFQAVEESIIKVDLLPKDIDVQNDEKLYLKYADAFQKTFNLVESVIVSLAKAQKCIDLRLAISDSEKYKDASTQTDKSYATATMFGSSVGKDKMASVSCTFPALTRADFRR